MTVTLCVCVLALFRLTNDISLDEYEDDDLSEVTEITDENGITLGHLDLDTPVSQIKPIHESVIVKDSEVNCILRNDRPIIYLSFNSYFIWLLIQYIGLLVLNKCNKIYL